MDVDILVGQSFLNILNLDFGNIFNIGLVQLVENRNLVDSVDDSVISQLPAWCSKLRRRLQPCSVPVFHKG